MNTSAIDEVNGKVAIVTGAASGIGRATAEFLHARCAKVVAVMADGGYSVQIK
jgi:NAD(P)-dependent dehydrogenase (short-subunit alcohol dehydrogenase family)